MDKSQMRKALASLSFTEKVKILEKLRDRDQAIAAAGLKRRRAPRSTPEASEKKND